MEPIAIVGLACLFPDAETPEEFWRNLVEERDSTSPATSNQTIVDPATFYEPRKREPDKCYWLRGGFIRDFGFDAEGYELPAASLERLDDVFKWSLYVAKQALLDSGHLHDRGSLASCGIILGNLSFPTKSSRRLFSRLYTEVIESSLREIFDRRDFQLEPLPGDVVAEENDRLAGFASSLVARALALGGTSFTLDAACASSLYAVKLASEYLRSGQADLMLAGAVSCADPLFIHAGFSALQAYPHMADSRPLDALSGGLTSGEGAACLVLKRYRDAVRDGDRIYANVAGIGLSNDGKGRHLLAPNAKGQVLAFERAYADAHCSPQSVGYVECHGTGTAAGDSTELNAMEEFFGRYQAAPLVGSVKSNVGHLLTVAGMASLIKAVLSMNHGCIPATIRVRQPLSSQNGVISGTQMVRVMTPWPGVSPVRRAGVSAFGFGGVNAHVVLERRPTGARDESAAAGHTAPRARLAIIGMDAFFGQCPDLASLRGCIRAGTSRFVPLPTQRWKGIDDCWELLRCRGLEAGRAPVAAYIDGFELDFLENRIPPHPLDQPIPQQLLMLKVANNAIRDAGLQYGENVGVLIATGTELALHQWLTRLDLSWQLREGLKRAGLELSSAEQGELEKLVKGSLHPQTRINMCTSFIGNVIASRIAALWDFSGPAFTISSEENSVFKALDLSQLLLSGGEVDAVVLGGVDLAGGAESVLRRKGLSVPGEGAGVLVLKRHDRAVREGNRIYAAVDAVSVVQAPTQPAAEPISFRASSATVAEACERALAAAGISASDVGYLELHHSGIADEDGAEMDGLLQAYGNRRPALGLPVGSVKGSVGHTYCASGIVSLIKAAQCLHERFIPATSGLQWTGAWRKRPFSIVAESRPWGLEAGASRRIAAVDGLGLDGAAAHVILTAEDHQAPRRRTLDPARVEKSLVKTITLGGDRIRSKLVTAENIGKFRPPVKHGGLAYAALRRSEPAMTRAQVSLLESRRESLRQMGNLIHLQGRLASQVTRPAGVIWDAADLLEFAAGRIAPVFGPEYAAIDTYRRRVRLPMPPFLLADRVTRLNAARGKFEPSSLTTEFDIPSRAWYSVDGQIPWAIVLESGQCDLLLISYLGIDFQLGGERVYRLLDCTHTFFGDLPHEGQTLRYDITVKSFVRSAHTLLFFFGYDCFVDDKLILRMDRACAGFFSDAELQRGRGVMEPPRRIVSKSAPDARLQHAPLRVCSRARFSETDMANLSHGKIAASFGASYEQHGLNASLRLPRGDMLMLDRVLSVHRTGGQRGLGLLVAEKDLSADHWNFQAHFKDDPALAGSLMVEGCVQLLQFYMLFLGLQTCTRDARFQPIRGVSQVARCRGQVAPGDTPLTYRMDLTEIGLLPAPYAIANADITVNGKTVVRFTGLGVRLVEKRANPGDG